MYFFTCYPKKLFFFEKWIDKKLFKSKLFIPLCNTEEMKSFIFFFLVLISRHTIFNVFNFLPQNNEPDA